MSKFQDKKEKQLKQEQVSIFYERISFHSGF